MSKTIVMVVSKNPQFTYLMQTYIHKSGWQMQVTSLEQNNLMDLIQNVKPEVLLLDTDDGGLNPLTLLESLRNEKALNNLPVLICSWVEDKIHEWRDKHSIFLDKPVLYGDFQQTLLEIGIAPIRN